MALAGCQGLYFYPDRREYPTPYLAQTKRVDAWIASSDGTRLHGWMVKPGSPPLGTVVFFHGNAQNLTAHVGNVAWLVKAGYQVLVFDYRGYGKSEGEPTIEGVNGDGLAILDAAFARPDVDPRRVAVLGQSLGAAVAVFAVANSPHRERVRLLVIDSAFAGYRRVARDKLGALILTWPLQYPLSLFFDDRFSAERWIDRVSPLPVLVLHGGLDRVVPVEHAKILHQKAREPKGLWIVQDAGHTQAFSNADLRERFLSVLAEHVTDNAPVYPGPALP